MAATTIIIFFLSLSPSAGTQPLLGGPQSELAAPTGIPLPTANKSPHRVKHRGRKQKPEVYEVIWFVTHIPDGKFGYTVFLNGWLLIDQQTIPGIQGSAGFASMTDAEKTARLVEKKIHAGEIPPSVSVEELRELGIRLPAVQQVEIGSPVEIQPVESSDEPQ